MEDVVLHVRPSSSEQVVSLLQSSERLLSPFPLRPPPPFTPWFISTSPQLPIRPARAAPVITRLLESEGVSSTTIQQNVVSGKNLLQAPLTTNATGGVSRRSEAKLATVTHCWSVSRTPGDAACSSPSKRFRRLLSVHRLHPLQRLTWVIGQDNCGPRSVEQVWRSLLRIVCSSKLPTCNSNLQHQRSEIWVFCDAMQAEHVGRQLKEELQLIGQIRLSTRRLSRIFSM